MNASSRTLTCAALLLTSTPAMLFAQRQGELLVLSKGAHTLSIVDTATLRVKATAPVGDDPHEVIASADGRTAYVSNYGSGTLHTLAVIDLETAKAQPSIDLGALRGPHGLAFVDGELWFTVEGSKALGRLQPSTQQVDLALGTGQNRTHMIHVTPGGEHLIVSNVSSGTVSFLDLEPVRMPPPPPGAGVGRPPSGGPPPGMPPNRKDWNETVVKVGNGSEGFDVSPDGREVWVANAQDGTISVIDAKERHVVQTLQAQVPGANRLKFTPDGRHVLVSMLGQGNLAVLDAATHKVSARIPIGTGAAGILIDPAGTRAYVACTPDNSVAVIDLATLKVVGRIDTGPEPDGMAWASR